MNRPVILGRNDGCDECENLGYICDECVDEWFVDPMEVETEVVGEGKCVN